MISPAIFLLVIITKQTIALNFNFSGEFLSQAVILAKDRLSPGCQIDLLAFNEAFNKKEIWTFQMIDASAKPQPGLFLGNIMHVGNYDECVGIKSPQGVKGQYCTALYDTNREDLKNLLPDFLSNRSKVEEGNLMTMIKTSYGFCVPKSCTLEDLSHWFNFTEEEMDNPIHFYFDKNISWEYCDDGETPPLTTSATIAVVIFSIFAIIITFSTLFDVLDLKTTNEMTDNLYTSFSLIKNGKKLFSWTTSQDTLECLNGLRVISMMWILLGHGFLYQFFLPQINAADIIYWREEMYNAFMAGVPHAVDTFFTIGGLLVVYQHLKNRDKGVKFSLPKFYLHRIIRLSPALVMTVLFYATLIKYTGNGPYWPIINELFQKPCETNWWSTLLYVQNYVHPHETCVGQTWYLAVDTQMYFLSPIILYFLVRWPKHTIGAIFVLVMSSSAYVFGLTWTKGLGASFFDQEPIHYETIYAPTHVRGSVYLIGMVCGYYVFQYKYKKTLKIGKWMVLGLWAISLLVMLVIAFWNMLLLKRDDYTTIEASLFNSLTRISWSVALSVIIFLCINGYGSLINTFLSNQAFTVLIRLNYTVYLIHIFVMITVLGQQRNPSYFSNLIGFHKFWGDYVFSLGLAVIWTLAFELPMLGLEKNVFGKTEKSDQNGQHHDGPHI